MRAAIFSPPDGAFDVDSNIAELNRQYSSVDLMPPCHEVHECGGDWTGSFDKEGWSTCTVGCAMAGLTRAGCADLHCLEGAPCCRTSSVATTCEEDDITGKFDSAGWVHCPDDRYMGGLERSGSVGVDNGLGFIEKMRCCKDDGMTTTNCAAHDVGGSFDHAGTVQCPGNKVMTGMYRSGSSVHDKLYHIEQIQCCDVVTSTRLEDPLGTGHAQSMIDSPQAWTAAHNANGEWMTIDAGENIRMTGVVTQGRADAQEWVTSYSVQTSSDGTVWSAPTYCTGNSDQSTKERCRFKERTARHMKITVHGFVSRGALLISAMPAAGICTTLTALTPRSARMRASCAQ